ncbi:MAG: hypothetical protein ABSG61_04470 [Gemmatimonadales bacterium]|jgi:hypothetical protein
MPITAKLSRKFYEKLGDEVADELVNWLNAVDLSYRQEFRELFEAHFGRFEARLGQQTAELRSEMGRQETRLIRWMFGFWVGAWLAIAGTIVALQRLL